MRELKANTTATIKLGPFLDKTDGITAEAGEDLDRADVLLSKNGSALTQKNETGADAAYDAHGFYDVLIDATDTNTPGELLVSTNLAADANATPAWQRCMVLSEFEWDRKYGTEGVNSGRLSGVQWYGTFASIAATTITLPVSHNLSEGRVMVILDGGTSATDARCKSRIGTLATNTITVDPAWNTDGETTPTTLTGQVISIPKSPTSSVPTAALADGHLVAAKFGADCLTNAKIADDAIAAENLKTGAISADAFAADAIVAATLATGAISADAFAANALVAATFAADCLAAAKFATGALTADAFAADALVAATFATSALTADAFAADALEAGAFATDSITNDALAASAVDEILDEVIAGTTTLRQLCRGLEAVLLGKVSGMESNAPVFRDRADTMSVVSATTDADGNRTAVTLDLDDTP